MAKRPDISVILLFNRQVVRADFLNKQLASEKPETEFFVNETLDVEFSLYDAVSQVVNGFPPLSTRTIVLSSDVWSQIVSVPRLSVTGIEPEELLEVLKFEAETLSGIDIDEISLASTPLGPKDDQQQYWVSAIRRSDLDDVNKLLESVGCREIAIAHPAGLAGKPSSPVGPNGNSIEIWDELCFHLTNRGSQLTRVKQASTDEIDEATPILCAGQTPSVSNAQTRMLETADEITLFAADVSTNYVQRLRDLTTPLIRLTKGSRVAPVRHLLSGLIAIAVLGFCFWHSQYLRDNNQHSLNQIELAKQPALEKKKYDTQLISILEQRAKVEMEDTALGDDLKRVRFFLDAERNRFSKLLTLLVDLRTDDLVIKEIGSTEEGVEISGVSLNGEASQALAKRLRERTVPLGWAVNPARQDGQEKLTTGGPWTFKILLTDTGPFEMAVQPRKKTSTNSPGKP